MQLSIQHLNAAGLTREGNKLTYLLTGTEFIIPISLNKHRSVKSFSSTSLQTILMVILQS